MNLQQAGQPKSSNGYGRRKSEREGAIKSENKILSGKLNASRLTNTGKIKGCVIYYYLFVAAFRMLICFLCCQRCGDWQ